MVLDVDLVDFARLFMTAKTMTEVTSKAVLCRVKKEGLIAW